MEFNSFFIWCLDSTWHIYKIVPEINIDTSPPWFMVCNIVINFIRSESALRISMINIIWILRLIEVSSSIITIPFKKITKSVLTS